MDATSGRGELGDRGLVADFYRLGKRAEYKIERIGADEADSRVDRADSIILGGIQDWVDWGGRSGLADAAEYEILDGADWGGRGGRGRGGRMGRAWGGVRGGLGSLGWACQRTGRTDWDVHVQVN